MALFANCIIFLIPVFCKSLKFKVTEELNSLVNGTPSVKKTKRDILNSHFQV